MIYKNICIDKQTGKADNRTDKHNLSRVLCWPCSRENDFVDSQTELSWFYEQLNYYLQYNRNLGDFSQQHIAEMLLNNWQQFLDPLIVMRKLTRSYCTCCPMLLFALSKRLPRVVYLLPLPVQTIKFWNMASSY